MLNIGVGVKNMIVTFRCNNKIRTTRWVEFEMQINIDDYCDGIAILLPNHEIEIQPILSSYLRPLKESGWQLICRNHHSWHSGIGRRKQCPVSIAVRHHLELTHGSTTILHFHDIHYLRILINNIHLPSLRSFIVLQLSSEDTRLALPSPHQAYPIESYMQSVSQWMWSVFV